MQITHATMAKIGRYTLLMLASSALVQLAALWPPAWAVVAGLALIGLAYAGVFSIRYYGLFMGSRWAHRLNVERLDGGFLDFVGFAVCALMGASVTCLMVWI